MPTKLIEEWPERVPLEAHRADLAVQIPLTVKSGFAILRGSVLGVITASKLMRRRSRSNASAAAAANQKVIAVDDAAVFAVGDALTLEDGTAIGTIAAAGVNIDDNEVTCVDNLAVEVADGDAILASDGSQVAAAIANEAVAAAEAADTVLSPYIGGLLKESLMVGLDESAKLELGGVSLPGDVFKF